MYLLEHAVGVFMEREVKKFGVTSFTCSHESEEAEGADASNGVS